MPELPEVQTVLNGLEDGLATNKIIELYCLYPGTVKIDTEASNQALPAKIRSFERRGKYLIMHLETAHSLVIHLRMTGKLVIAESTQSDPVHPHLRAWFRLDQNKDLLFIDPRTFGKIVLCRTENLANYLAKLGPEPLTEDFNVSYLRQQLKNRKKPIKNALLDQALVAGLGNIYVCEILYRAGVRPDAESSQITLKAIKAIVFHTKEVLREALENNGTSISDFRRVDDKSGEFQNLLRVYQKQQCPLGHDITVIRQAGRSGFYCPHCQKK